MGYHTMGLLAIGIRAFGNVSGLDVKVVREAPGPQKISAWRPDEELEVA